MALRRGRKDNGASLASTREEVLQTLALNSNADQQSKQEKEALMVLIAPAAHPATRPLREECVRGVDGTSECDPHA